MRKEKLDELNSYIEELKVIKRELLEKIIKDILKLSIITFYLIII